MKAYFKILCCIPFIPFIAFSDVEVKFSPNGGFAFTTQQQLQEAKNKNDTLDIAIYHFGHKGAFFQAVKAAVLRGVKVRLLLNYAVGEWATGDHDKVIEELLPLKAGNLEMRKTNRNNHQKMALININQRDYAIVNSSGNWDSAPDRTYFEDALFITHEDNLRESFKKEFELLWEVSNPL